MLSLRVMPLRLFSRPMTATRSAMGVPGKPTMRPEDTALLAIS
jgi:hypothetical protein